MYARKSKSRLLLSFLLFLGVVGPTIGCDSDDTNSGPAVPDATASSIAPRQMTATPAGPVVEPGGSCLDRCLRQWQTCAKRRTPRPGNPVPAEDDCTVAAGQCLSACPAAADKR